MVVNHPSKKEGKMEYSISVTTDAFPITVSWEAIEALTLFAGGRMVCRMEGDGSVQFKSAIDLAIGIGTGANVPDVFALGKNYPNPFNPVTRFTVDIPRLVDLRLAIYNVLGQNIKTLMSGEVTPGSYKMEWDGTDDRGVSVPSGIYFIRMISGSFSDTQKVIFLK
jgi:FlgD Ig-like domain